jgi:hypothetical protein
MATMRTKNRIKDLCNGTTIQLFLLHPAFKAVKHVVHAYAVKTHGEPAVVAGEIGSYLSQVTVMSGGNLSTIDVFNR